MNRHNILICAGIVSCLALFSSFKATAETPSRLVLLHTNDTHSQIDPNNRDRGGMARRKVLVDSVRAASPATLLIDAGDAVQGTLFFSLFKGEVEDSLMNLLGYDIQILGNHEFDNTIEELASRWSRLGAERISTNYDLTASALNGVLKPYTIRQFGDKKIGFIGINLDPAGMIAAHHSEGVVYLDPIEAANSMAWYLRNVEHMDYVVVVSHIGYSAKQRANDLDLARKTKGIDIIIGGHSHTEIDPSKPGAPVHLVQDADGDTVLIAQNAGSGVTLGEIEIDFTSGQIKSRLIPVDSRLDPRTDGTVETFLKPYRASIDSICNIVLATTPEELIHRSPALVNLVSDIVAAEGRSLSGRDIDFAIMNKGGIRRGIPQGAVTRGVVMEMMPFDNRIVVMDISGRDLVETFDIMASQGGQGVSSAVKVTYDPEQREAETILINGEPIDPARTYTIATVDYLAGGGDYLTPLKRGTITDTDPRIAFDAISDWLSAHPAIHPDHNLRMVAK